MRIPFIKPLAVILASSLIISCSTWMDDGRMSEGLIEYRVTYPKLEEGSVLAELLPTKMIMKFKDDQFVTELSAGFGMFKMCIVNNGDDKEFWQTVKLINERFKVSYDEEKAANSLKSMPKVDIKKTGKSKFIADFECYEAIVTVLTDSVESFTIYYTDKIRLNQPNWFTQYSGIDGVLMEYQVDRYGIGSRFSAVQVIPQEVEDEVFEITDDFIEITEAEMEEKLMNIFNSFSE